MSQKAYLEAQRKALQQLFPSLKKIIALLESSTSTRDSGGFLRSGKPIMKEVTIVIKAREDGTVIVDSEVPNLQLVAILFSMAFDALKAAAENCQNSTNTLH